MYITEIRFFAGVADSVIVIDIGAVQPLIGIDSRHDGSAAEITGCPGYAKGATGHS
ncbi:hypothetical protein D3C73_1363810 [compost metagenome]